MNERLRQSADELLHQLVNPHCKPRYEGIAPGAFVCTPRPRLGASEASAFLDVTPSAPARLSHHATRQGSGVDGSAFIRKHPAEGLPHPVPSSFKAFPKYKPEDGYDSKFRRKFHNWFLENGMKFQVAYKSPLIQNTDMFDLMKFGCGEHSHADDSGLLGGAADHLFDAIARYKGSSCLATGDCGKPWWIHPSITFGTNLREVGVKLEDLTSGDVRWDAVYSLHGRNKLHEYDRPIGGEHPFFQPYGPAQLENSYQWENQDEGELHISAPQAAPTAQPMQSFSSEALHAAATA
eukprot:TRINITY_DN16800_c0_g1_i1.p1 TRINITY_DN16800_c0_g1~~TRINITY_DN16800_c0_g1_i1.p1  ORF type:complete len:293 (+),score=17.66 TRINITY_DN16800_c0_g1_i1:144-1022(+)